MDPDKARALYGSHYADLYNGLWEESDTWAPETRLHVEWLSRCIDPNVRWLDVGCGTGWILSQFPDIMRAGIDLSPSMLERARAANPGALEFRQGDIRDDIPDWFGSWDLVSSTGHAWCYVSSIDEVETIAENMARWAAPTGTVFVQPPDLCDLTGHQLSYDFTGGPPGQGNLAITGVVWSFTDEGGVHENMIWPSLDVWVGWYSKWFHRVEVHTWPHEPEFLPCPRKILIARGKRAPGDMEPAEVYFHPGPGQPDQEVQVFTSSVTPEPLSQGTNATEPVRLVDRPLSHLIERAAPWRPELWRALRHRGRRLLSR